MEFRRSSSLATTSRSQPISQPSFASSRNCESDRPLDYERGRKSIKHVDGHWHSSCSPLLDSHSRQKTGLSALSKLLKWLGFNHFGVSELYGHRDANR